jgi:DNA-binding LacI/PurR family transcriptional regulator/biotin operon repressor
MKQHSFSTVTDQVAEALLDGIRQRRWGDQLPGRVALARELGVNHKTVETALKTLEKAGWLERQGSGKGRKITRLEAISPRALRILMLGYERNDLMRHETLNLLHRLREAGHLASLAKTTMHELGMNATRIARFVERNEADAWIVEAGPREVLEWFAARPTPVFALYGRRAQIRIASSGPDKNLAVKELMARLIGYGHQRIVLLVREERRKPVPGVLERSFIQQLEANGIRTSAYNLPDWGDTPEELHRILDSLFQHTPPTALIIGDITLFFATMQYLVRIGISAPGHVSLACTDSNPNFDWCRPHITHIAWNSSPVINRVVNWANNVSRGRDDRRASSAMASLVIGGTIGPVPGNVRSIPISSPHLADK